MKKLILISLITLVSTSLFAQENKGENEFGSFKIVKDAESKDVQQGACVIYGKVKAKSDDLDEFQVGFQQEGIPKINYRLVDLDDKGNFKIVVPAQKGVVYCNSPNNNEIPIPLREYKSGHKVKITFKSTETVLRFNSRRLGPGVKKPVVYLYSDKEINANLKLDLKGGSLSFTYPKYENEWNAKVGPNGLEVEGKKYPYLFWEGNKPGLDFLQKEKSTQANIVKKENVIEFLENSLTTMGLNSTEQTDFITFWAPKMIQFDEMAVQFLVNEDYNHIAHINVSPKPDNSLRIYMLYQEVTPQEAKNFTPQEIPNLTAERKGFTLVEWGGSELIKKTNLALD